MPPTFKSRYSTGFAAFQCTGSACEDTCCRDWGVSIDRNTYGKYQSCGDPELQPLLQQLVQINPAPQSDQDFARIALTGNSCPFLAEGWCSTNCIHSLNIVIFSAIMAAK